MVSKNLITRAQISIHVTIGKVWEAFVNPNIIKKYMFGTTVISDWKEGSQIIWKGEWKGKPYEDKGTILQFNPPKKLQYSHFSPLMGQPDIPENYHIVTIHLIHEGKQTIVTLSQDKNTTEEEKKHSA